MLMSVRVSHADSVAQHQTDGDAEAGLDDSGESTPDTGSALEFLHESLLTSDPTGAEGQDLFT